MVKKIIICKGFPTKSFLTSAFFKKNQIMTNTCKKNNKCHNELMSTSSETFKSESDFIKFLLKAFFFFVHLAIMTEIVAYPSLKHVLRFIFFLYLSRPYYKTIKNRYYTFWTFSLFLLIYLFYKVYELHFVFSLGHIAILYLISSVILILKMYELSSPIYYPRFNWWEYDFRYRDDLKILVKALSHNDFELKARLTDLRRYAGCVALFEELKPGEEILISVDVNGEAVKLRGIVISRRRELLGRPYIYGIKFKFDSRTNKKRYTQLKKIWNKEKASKKRLKLRNAN